MDRLADSRTVMLQAIDFDGAGEPRTPRQPSADSPERLRIHVICTGAGETRLALSAAVAMSSGLDAEIALIDPPSVPYPLAPDRPDATPAFTFRRLRALALSAGARPELFICLCRDPLEGLLRVLRRRGPVLFGIRRRMLPFSLFQKSERLAASLRRHGFEVIEVTCR